MTFFLLEHFGRKSAKETPAVSMPRKRQGKLPRKRLRQGRGRPKAAGASLPTNTIFSLADLLLMFPGRLAPVVSLADLRLKCRCKAKVRNKRTKKCRDFFAKMLGFGIRNLSSLPAGVRGQCASHHTFLCHWPSNIDILSYYILCGFNTRRCYRHALPGLHCVLGCGKYHRALYWDWCASVARRVARISTSKAIICFFNLVCYVAVFLCFMASYALGGDQPCLLLEYSSN